MYKKAYHHVYMFVENDNEYAFFDCVDDIIFHLLNPYYDYPFIYIFKYAINSGFIKASTEASGI